MASERVEDQQIQYHFSDHDCPLLPRDSSAHNRLNFKKTACKDHRRTIVENPDFKSDLKKSGFLDRVSLREGREGHAGGFKDALVGSLL